MSVFLVSLSYLPSSPIFTCRATTTTTLSPNPSSSPSQTLPLTPTPSLQQQQQTPLTCALHCPHFQSYASLSLFNFYYAFILLFSNLHSTLTLFPVAQAARTSSISIVQLSLTMPPISLNNMVSPISLLILVNWFVWYLSISVISFAHFTNFMRLIWLFLV